MGATTFYTIERGESSVQAFHDAQKIARYDYGHRGYTGTIADKKSFVEIKLPPGRDAREFAAELIKKKDPRVDDPYGTAGCIQLEEHAWLFFGWAKE